MPDHDEAPTVEEPPVARGPDPLEGDDPEALRHEILRLRDLSLGDHARNAVLEDRISELEAQVEGLADRNRTLEAELARNPVVRTARAAGAVLRRLGRRR